MQIPLATEREKYRLVCYITCRVAAPAYFRRQHDTSLDPWIGKRRIEREDGRAQFVPVAATGTCMQKMWRWSW
jgi:hypothetical protein